MKTAEDLTKDFVAGFMSAHTEDYVINSIKQIQLDAMKEGARRAAKIAIETESENCMKIADDKVPWPSEAILTAAEKWTEKDL